MDRVQESLFEVYLSIPIIFDTNIDLIQPYLSTGPTCKIEYNTLNRRMSIGLYTLQELVYGALLLTKISR